MTRAITIALLLAICSPARADERVSLTMGRFTAAGDYGYFQQALSVKNSTEAAIEWVALECGFFHGDQLVATGVDSVVNLQAGQTGYATVSAKVTSRADIPERADCRVRW
jgi:hypothetical protein